jgi:hypothetical protein
MLALMVLAVAVLGVISLLLVLRSRNESSASARHATRACQEMMELVLGQSHVKTMPQLAAFWNVQTFKPKKVFLAEKDVYNPTPAGEDIGACGRVNIRDISDAEHPGSLWEIAVWVDTTGLTTSPIKTSLVTRRSAK